MNAFRRRILLNTLRENACVVQFFALGEEGRLLQEALFGAQSQDTLDRVRSAMGRGVEVADLNEARGLALEAIAEMIQDHGGEITDWRGWRLEAVDASGTALFTISLDALPS